MINQKIDVSIFQGMGCSRFSKILKGRSPDYDNVKNLPNSFAESNFAIIFHKVKRIFNSFNLFTRLS
jgi:hypothetical protein